VNILYIDSSTEACTAGVSAGETTLSGFEIAPRGHAGLLMPMAERLMAEAGLDFEDLDLVGFGRGPGSFTGVRIATAMAQGIAITRDLPMAPVSSLACLAFGAWSRYAATLDPADRDQPHEVRVAIDARMGEIYRASYRVSSGTLQPLLEEAVVAPGFPATGDVPVLAAGTGFGRYPELLEVEGLIAGDPEALPRAEHALDLIRAMPPEARIAPDRAIPRYLRDRVTG
jgi:tRNA threonylcarbamoyladenosine biosynthesis protein TsaB